MERAKFLKHPGRSCAESGYGFECPHLVGELGYHIALVRLLSLCSFGRNHKTEVQCRSLLSVNEIQRTYCDDDSLPALNVRSNYIYLLNGFIWRVCNICQR